MVHQGQSLLAFVPEKPCTAMDLQQHWPAAATGATRIHIQQVALTGIAISDIPIPANAVAPEADRSQPIPGKNLPTQAAAAVTGYRKGVVSAQSYLQGPLQLMSGFELALQEYQLAKG